MQTPASDVEVTGSIQVPFPALSVAVYVYFKRQMPF